MNEDTIITGVYKIPVAYKYFVAFAQEYGWKGEGDPVDFSMNFFKQENDKIMQSFIKRFIEAQAAATVQTQIAELQEYVADSSSVDKIIE